MCFRCGRNVTNEEAYLYFRKKYCRACDIVIKNDPAYEKLFWRLKQIEN